MALVFKEVVVLCPWENETQKWVINWVYWYGKLTTVKKFESWIAVAAYWIARRSNFQNPSFQIYPLYIYPFYAGDF